MTISGRLTTELRVTDFDDLPYDEAYVIDAIAENELICDEEEEDDDDED